MSEPKRESGKGYGNIYTPHAGSMIIHVQRESGLQNRTLVLSTRQVRLLRFVTSRYGLIVLAVVVGSWTFFAAQAARVPLLRTRIANMERDAARMDTLQRTVVELQARYEQVQRMLGAAPASRPAAEAVATDSASSGSAATGPGAPGN